MLFDALIDQKCLKLNGELYRMNCFLFFCFLSWSPKAIVLFLISIYQFSEGKEISVCVLSGETQVLKVFLFFSQFFLKATQLDQMREDFVYIKATKKITMEKVEEYGEVWIG